MASSINISTGEKNKTSIKFGTARLVSNKTAPYPLVGLVKGQLHSLYVINSFRLVNMS